MAATIINGNTIATKIKQRLKQEIAERKHQHIAPPQLDVILVGDDPASAIYVRTKQRACEAAGLKSRLHHLPADISQQQLESVIDQCNNDKECHGILLQLPLPSHLQAQDLLAQIKIEKDVDGFHPYNMGQLAQGHPILCPCTPHGIMTLLKEYAIDVKGLDATIVGASNIVGRPMALELLAAGATITVCHSKTKDLEQKVKGADLLIVGIGNPNIVKTDWIKPGAIIIDVGFNRLDNGKIVGDIDFETAKEKASFITPVPGGVGPMTVATLLENTLQAMKMQNNSH